MKKINFSNLPSTTTPINATNLNTMQGNIEAEIKLSDVSDLITLNGASFATTYTSKIFKQNNIVSMQLYLSLDTPTQAELNQAVATLDASIKPRNAIMIPCLIGSTGRSGWNHEYMGQASISASSGNIQVRDVITMTDTSKKYICINATYMI